MNTWTIWVSAVIVAAYVMIVIIAFRRRFPKRRKRKYCPDRARGDAWSEIFDMDDNQVICSPEQLGREK